MFQGLGRSVPIAAGTTMVALALACSPTLPPTTVPSQPDPAFEPLKTALQAYVDQTQPFLKVAAQEAERVPGKAGVDAGAEKSVRVRQNALADALRQRLRPNAKQGDLVSAPVAAAIVKDIQRAFDSPRKDLLIDDLAEQNTTPANAATPVVNQRLEAPRVPPRLMEVLPPLPKQLEYDFAGRTLILRDVDADVVVDFVPNALPAPMPVSEVKEGAAKPQPPGAISPLPMPQIRGGTVFVAMGDMGSGD